MFTACHTGDKFSDRCGDTISPLSLRTWCPRNIIIFAAVKGIAGFSMDRVSLDNDRSSRFVYRSKLFLGEHRLAKRHKHGHERVDLLGRETFRRHS